MNKLKPPKRLIAGDPKSIEYAREYKFHKFEEEVFPKMRCPGCRGKAVSIFEKNNTQESEPFVGINFDCDSKCVNSIEYAEEHGYGDEIVYFDLRGRPFHFNDC